MTIAGKAFHRVATAASMLALATALGAAPGFAHDADVADMGEADAGDANAGGSDAGASGAGTGDAGTGAGDAGTAHGRASEAEFDPAFFNRTGGSSVDVSRFSKGNPVPAGRYRVDLSVNGKYLSRVEIAFQASDSEQAAKPCFDEALLDKVGIDLSRTAPENIALLRGGPFSCPSLAAIVPDAVTSFSLGDQRLDVSIPQAALRRDPRGYVDPRFWDQGIAAGMVGYNFNLFNTTGRAANTQGYLGLNAGFNLGAWRFRHDGSLSFGSGQDARYQSNRIYARRDITALQSQLTIGQAFTDGQLFDSIGYRGVSLATDDQMWPQSQRGFAPVVRGTARTNANVEIRQNGNLVYQAAVAPGRFEITDLYATGYGGDLVVTVTEADGRIETFTVPFASIPQLLRHDMTRFSVTAGQVDSQLSRGEHPLFLQATAQHGFSNMLTGYGGVVLAGDYRGALAGVALNTKLGAFGADITVADAGLPGIDSKGASVRLSYARLIPSTGTNFTLAAYRYSSKGFWSMQNALTARAQARNDSGDGDGDNDGDHGVYDIARPRNSFQISVSQPLGPRWGSLYLTGSTQQYWNRRGTTTYYQAGYSNVFKGVGYSFSASRQSDSITGRPDNRFMLTLSFRAGRGTYAPNVTSSLAAGGREPFQAQTTLSGSLGADNLLNYGATYSHSGDSDSFGGTLQYQSRIANLTGGVGIGDGYTQQSLGVTGALLLHSGGVTLGPSWSDSMALVHAPGAKGARVSSRPGVRIDGNGYALVPYLMPYAQNRVEIDPKGLGLDVELAETSQTVAPRQGAVVKLEYASVIGRAAIIAGKLADGSNIPFGASAMSADGQVIGQAGQGGRIFVRGVDDSGSLTLTWGDAPDQRCRLDYRLPPPDLKADAIAYEVAEALCRTGEAKDPASLIAERSK